MSAVLVVVCAVTLLIHGGPRLSIDFTGSAATHQGNLNAPRAVTVAAVIYVLLGFGSGLNP